jgi:hypothetical protein
MVGGGLWMILAAIVAIVVVAIVMVMAVSR